MKEILKNLILRFQESGIPRDLIHRDLDLEPYLHTYNAVVIAGPRRAGKTYLLFQFMATMMRDLREIIYLNFEDNVLVDFTFSDLEQILVAYQELYPGRKPSLFLDEVHNIPRWELFVRKLVDRKYRVFVTGSNAELLSKEYATKLGGRYLELEVFPLSFKEFLKFKKVTYDEKVLYSDVAYQLLALFREYIDYGGFPEVVLAQDPVLKEKLIEAYFRTATYRDVLRRYKIKDEVGFEIVLKKTAENIGKPFSFRSVVKKLRPLGYHLGTQTIINYYDYAVKGYLLFPASQWRESMLKRESERKMYFVDNGYLRTFLVTENLSKKFENTVARYFYFDKKKLYYFRSACEIDILAGDMAPIQVSYSLSSPEAEEREIKCLWKYLDLTDSSAGYILTWNERRTIRRGDKRIYVLPFWYISLFGLENFPQ